MRNASVEWMARVAARNEIETAKARRALRPASTRLVALSAGGRTVAASATAPGIAGRGGRDGSESEVAR